MPYAVGVLERLQELSLQGAWKDRATHEQLPENYVLDCVISDYGLCQGRTHALLNTFCIINLI